MKKHHGFSAHRVLLKLLVFEDICCDSHYLFKDTLRSFPHYLVRFITQSLTLLFARAKLVRLLTGDGEEEEKEEEMEEEDEEDPTFVGTKLCSLKREGFMKKTKAENSRLNTADLNYMGLILHWV